MTNSDKFKEVFGTNAEEFWSKYESEMLEWIITEYKEPWPRHGYFRLAKDGHSCECSECGTVYGWIEADTMRYCKKCGARMDEAENEQS